MSGDIPNPMEWHLIADTSLDPLIGTGPHVPGRPLYEGDAADTRALLQAMKYAYRCPKCSGLWIFWDGLESEGRFYRQTALTIPP